MTEATDVAGPTERWIWPGLVDTSGDTPRLLGSHCPSCGGVFYPPVEDCPTEVLPGATKSVVLSGRGRLVSYSVIKRGLPGFASPYALANIELEEGPTCIAQLQDWEADDLVPGRPVEFVVGQIRTDDEGNPVVGPKFKPLADGAKS